MPKQSSLFRSFIVLLVILIASVTGAVELPEETTHSTPLEINVSFPTTPLFSLDIDIEVAVSTELRATALEMIGWLIDYGSVNGSYTVDLDQDDLLSVTLQYYGYTRYMAHPAHLAKSLTFDLKTGERLYLDDLFLDDTYIQLVSKRIAEQITERDIPLLRPFETISPEQDFRLTPDGLVIYFQPYDLAPYYWGFPEFHIPYDDLADLATDYITRLK